MSETQKDIISHAVFQLAIEMDDNRAMIPSWAACSNSLVDLVVAIGEELSPMQITTIISIAATTLRQASRANADAILLEVGDD